MWFVNDLQRMQSTTALYGPQKLLELLGAERGQLFYHPGTRGGSQQKGLCYMIGMHCRFFTDTLLQPGTAFSTPQPVDVAAHMLVAGRASPVIGRIPQERRDGDRLQAE